ncbi:T9SS type A sorting domain-containing protein [Paracrocinitomix mangrovi]|uniref:T9SS type A sorting domain-containing protein n=1 Tax=Paracrocinitomix mangrovi TaxID=2862509 RepID=UPI001C8E5626|nr:T9SS type A sorting domain-containing protein [Paracrocinitomix mangrovi]UKN03575.1 T9SS type A sorting domain-containing protein [Paracrocinitomix mangrovi]
MRHLIIFIWLFPAFCFGQNFTEVIKAVAADRDVDDRLGYAVTIDGNWAAIGAYGDDYSAVDPNMGSVYIFEQQGLNNWVQVQKLSASDQGDYDRFGWSVDMHEDFLIVGAYGDDEDENDANYLSKAGSAYIFKNINGTWTEMQKIVASDRDADDEFGWSVAIYDSTAIVGAHIEDHDPAGNNFKYHSGSAYAFELGTNGIWTETQKICATDRWVDMNYPNGYSGEDLADQFGGSLDLWGDWLIVGAHHHDYATTSPLTGAMWSSGAAYIFERTGSSWTQVQKIQNFDREPWDRFGYAVTIDSNMIAVCAYSEDEDTDGVSNPLTNPGSVYLWERDGGGSWNAIQKIVPNDRSSGDHFGYSLDIDDTLMIIGCHSDDHDEFGADVKDDAGSAYVFEKNGGVWSQLQKLDASDRVTGDDLGISVGISGYSILVGAQYQDFNTVAADSLEDAGAAYFYSNNLCPILASSITATICSGDSYQVGPYSHDTSGIFVDVIPSVAGCDSTVTLDLTVEDEMITHVNASMCDGGTYYVFGFPTTVPGNYSYTLTAQNGCDSVVITHLTMDAPITNEQWVTICYGDSYTIGLNTYTESGTYEDVVSATNFCDSTITTHLTVELPLDKSISQSISMLTANEDNADTYQWFNCDTNLPISGATNQTFYASEVGNYGVIVSKNGCSDTSACVYVSWIVANTENQILDQNLNIYPNPSNGQFYFELNDDNPSGAINIYDTKGALIQQVNIVSKTTAINLSLSGVYIAEINTGSGIIRKKIVVQ